MLHARVFAMNSMKRRSSVGALASLPSPVVGTPVCDGLADEQRAVGGIVVESRASKSRTDVRCMSTFMRSFGPSRFSRSTRSLATASKTDFLCFSRSAACACDCPAVAGEKTWS